MIEPDGRLRFSSRPLQLAPGYPPVDAGVSLSACLPPSVRRAWDDAVAQLRSGAASASLRLGDSSTAPVLEVRPLDVTGERDLGLVAIGSAAQATAATSREAHCETVAEITRSVVYERELARDHACVTGSMRELLGYDPQQALTGGYTWWMSLVHPEDLAIAQSRFAAHRPDQSVTWSVEYRVRRADKSWAVVHDRGRSICATATRPAHVIGVLSDVTDTRALRDEVHRAKRLEIVARLAAGVAHDYNNVLSAINGFASVLIDTLDGDHESIADLRQIETLVARGASLSHNLLGLAKPRENSKARLVNVGDEVRRIAPTVRILLGARIECSFDTPPADRTIYIDSGSLDQVILNLAANARDAMPNGGKLFVRTMIDESSGTPRVRLEVADTGCGMPAEVLSSIFQPYYTTKGERRGTGLGLWLVREIVQGAGGAIRVDSVPQEGTCVVMEFPAVDEPPSGEPIPLPPPKAGKREAGHTVLFIEDEEMVRSVMRRILERFGFRVLAVDSSAEGLATLAARRHEIHAIITDLQMPGLSGVALVQQLREMAPEIGCIVTSGLAERLSGLTPAATLLELFPKPCEPGELVHALGRMARGTESRRTTPKHAAAS